MPHNAHILNFSSVFGFFLFLLPLKLLVVPARPATYKAAQRAGLFRESWGRN
jgi:hypothetical protein